MENKNLESNISKLENKNLTYQMQMKPLRFFAYLMGETDRNERQPLLAKKEIYRTGDLI